jgi:protein-tyrosine phosphatase
MQMINNFRDFGGAAAHGGRRVRRGILFRSGQTSPLGTTPFGEIEARACTTVVDLRFADEALQSPMPWKGVPNPSILSMVEGEHGDAPHHAFFRTALGDMEAVHQLYRDFYAFLPLDARYQELIGRALRRIARDEGPLLVHCSAGKDRTGFFAALLLGLLGVSRPAIDADFLASNAAPARAALRPELLRRFARHGRDLPDGPVLDAILGVKPDYLDASRDAILAAHGTLGDYLDAIGVDVAERRALRACFLEPAEAPAD